MAYGTLQRVRVRAVLHRQIYADLGNVHIGHDTTHRELFGIGQGRSGSPSLCDGRLAGQHSVVLLRGLPLGSQFGIIGVFNSGGVDCFYVRVVFLTQKFSHQRIKHQPQRCNTASRRQQPALHCSLLCLRDLTTMKAAAPSSRTPPTVYIQTP